MVNCLQMHMFVYINTAVLGTLVYLLAGWAARHIAGRLRQLILISISLTAGFLIWLWTSFRMLSYFAAPYVSEDVEALYCIVGSRHTDLAALFFFVVVGGIPLLRLLRKGDAHA